jgi:hypothetical protein
MSIPASNLVTAITSRSLRTATLPMHGLRSDNYLIDVKFDVIVDVEASRSIRQAEVGVAKTMIERTEEHFGLKPERFVGTSILSTGACRPRLLDKRVKSGHRSIHQYH